MTHVICSGGSCIPLLPRLSEQINKNNRPETVESLFIAFRLTGDQRYRDHGWAIFRAIETHCRIPSGGYATIVNVDEVPVRHEDKMETFFLVGFSEHFTDATDLEEIAERNAEVPVLALLGWRYDTIIE
jgi:hypothetical protein